MSYAAPETATIVKQMMGFNFLPRDLGQRINDSIIELIRAKKVHTVIGRQSPFEELPQAIAAMGQRETTGRIIITL
jgi:NADPH:quinone reductase-like Zn-dependent oxidoreductase